MPKKQSRWVEVWSDGSCSGNPGPGGCGALLRYNHHTRKVHSWACHTTNNRQEMMGAILALRTLTKPCRVWIYTDSQYVYYCATGKRKRKKNLDLWKILDKEILRHETVEWAWLRGHAGHEGNEVADGMAKRGTEIAKKYAKWFMPHKNPASNTCCGDPSCVKQEVYLNGKG